MAARPLTKPQQFQLSQFAHAGRHDLSARTATLVRQVIGCAAIWRVTGQRHNQCDQCSGRDDTLLLQAAEIVGAPERRPSVAVDTPPGKAGLVPFGFGQ